MRNTTYCEWESFEGVDSILHDEFKHHVE